MRIISGTGIWLPLGQATFVLAVFFLLFTSIAQSNEVNSILEGSIYRKDFDQLFSCTGWMPMENFDPSGALRQGSCVLEDGLVDPLLVSSWECFQEDPVLVEVKQRYCLH